MKRYLLTAFNISAENLRHKIIEAETIEEATEKLEVWCADIIKKHPLVVFENKKVTEITDNMNVIKFTKTNGYTLNNKLSDNIEKWESKANDIFRNELMIINHFYYGSHLDMADITLKDGNYMQYNITEKYIHCCG